MAARTLSLMPISTSISPSRSRKTISSSLSLPMDNKSTGLGSSILGDPVPLFARPVPLFRRPTLHSTTVFFMLPTAKPERVSAEKGTKWSARAIKSFSMGELEARKLKYPTTGTEALLMGILVEGTSLAAKFLRANGIMLFKVREETVKLLGKSDMYFFSPEHPPLTEPAQRALDWAVDEKLKSGYFLNPKYRYALTCRTITKEIRKGMKEVIKRVLTDVNDQVLAINQMDHYNAGRGSFGDVIARNAITTTLPGESGEVTTSHLLLGIWSEEDSAGHKILASFGFDNEKASELAKSANKDFAMNYS